MIALAQTPNAATGIDPATNADVETEAETVAVTEMPTAMRT